MEIFGSLMFLFIFVVVTSVVIEAGKPSRLRLPKRTLLRDGQRGVFEGTVELRDETLTAPLGNDPCCHYQFEAWTKKTFDRKVHASETSSVSFRVVNNEREHVLVEEPFLVIFDARHRIPVTSQIPGVRDFLKRNGRSESGWFTDLFLRRSSGIALTTLRGAMRVSVEGIAKRVSVNEVDGPSYRSNGEVYRMVAGPNVRVIVRVP